MIKHHFQVLFLNNLALVTILNLLFLNKLVAQCPPTITPYFKSTSNAIYDPTTREIKMCAGDTVVLLSTPSAAPGLTFEWYKGGILISGENTDSLKVSIAGNYRVKVLGGGCSQWSEITKVTVNSLPTMVITPNIIPPHICSGDNITLTVNTTPNAGVNWVWMQPAFIMGTNTNPLTLSLFSSTNF